MNDFSDFDKYCMKRVLKLARRGLYTTRENPRVGCVIAKNRCIISEGWHKASGMAHAEIEAISNMKEHTGTTAYVNLEPCCHSGKTPPCTESIIEAGIERVVVAIKDPNPLVSGNGVKNLIKAGIRVDVGLLEKQAKSLNAGFIKRFESGHPFVWLKAGSSIDGRIAMADGSSKYITSKKARIHSQKLRARVGAIITGIGTVLKDDPRLTVRFSDAKINPSPLSHNDQPLRIIVDSSGRLPKNPALVAEPGPIYWVTTKNHHRHPLIDNGRIKHLPVPANKDGRVDLSILVRELGLLEINEILVEAGGILSGAFIKAGLVDRARIYFASKILGCDAQAIYKIMPKDLPSAIEIKIKKVDKVGDSFFVEWILENS